MALDKVVADFETGDRFVLELLSKHNIQTHCLGITKAGYPRHPLYVMCSNQSSVYRYNLDFKVS